MHQSMHGLILGGEGFVSDKMSSDTCRLEISRMKKLCQLGRLTSREYLSENTLAGDAHICFVQGRYR